MEMNREIELLKKDKEAADGWLWRQNAQIRDCKNKIQKAKATLSKWYTLNFKKVNKEIELLKKN